MQRGEIMKKSLFVLFLFSVVFVIGCSQTGYAESPDFGREYITYFEDDFSGEDNYWVKSNCEYSSCPREHWGAVCGVDDVTETYRSHYVYNSSTSCGITSHKFLYSDPEHEFGDKLEFDLIIARHEDGRPMCEVYLDLWDGITLAEGDEGNGTYNFISSFDRGSQYREIIYPNGTSDSNEWDNYEGSLGFWYTPALVRIGHNSNDNGCGVDVRIDNVKVSKQRDSLGYKVLALWNRIFGGL
jgi:hypothetical protein